MISDHKDYRPHFTGKGLDHVRLLKNSFIYVNPPKYDQETPEWGNGVKKIAEEKLEELLNRYDLVENRYRKNVKLIVNTFDKSKGFTKEFFLTLEAHEASEVVYLKKWLKYWKRVYEAVSLKKLIPVEVYEDKRFTDDQLDRAREVPLETMFEGKLRMMAGKQLGLCPFHEEKTPSFTIFTGENKFHCFGCQEHGDAIDFYMKTMKVDFVEAVKGLLHE